MYLLWLLLLVLLLIFSFRPIPYLEGMTDKGTSDSTLTQDNSVKKIEATITPLPGPNSQTRYSYKVDTDEGTYAGYSGPNVQAKLTPDGYSVTGPKRTYYSSCSSTMYGCCPNTNDAKVDEAGSNCLPVPSSDPTSCTGTSYGCCPDQLTTKVDSNGSNCASYPPCAGSTFGCCPDGKTSKTDYNGSNCIPPPSISPAPSTAPTSCAGSSYGCCPDQLTAKVDSNGSNCATYPSNGMINLQPIRTPELDSYNTSTVFLSPPKKESTCPEPQPCPPCARCPEPSFDCKKVPNYSSANSGHLPVPILNDFSQFGM